MVLGAPAGLFGVLAGGLLGYMLDSVLSERRFRAWLAAPEGRAPCEALPGLLAALTLARRREDRAFPARRDHLLEDLLLASLRGLGLPRRLLPRPHPAAVLAILDEAPPCDIAALTRHLRLEGGPDARLLLAEALWAFEAAEGRALTWVKETELGKVMEEAGVEPLVQLMTREARFPGWKSPWEILGLEPGSPPEELRRAWRRLSKRWHPDLRAAGDDAARFREAKAAFEALSGGAGK